MRYYVTISGRTFEVELTGGQVRIDGVPVTTELRAVPGTAVRHLLLNGRSLPLLAARADARGGWNLRIGGFRLDAEVVDERTRAIREVTGAAVAATGPRPVTAPMPGLVVRVEVAPGQQVHPGQGLVIVEAMKMENELKADADARVARVLVEPGQAVEKGAVLVEFETD